LLKRLKEAEGYILNSTKENVVFSKTSIVPTLAAGLFIVNAMLATSVEANPGERIAQAYAVESTRPEVDPEYVAARVVEYFQDAPVMIAIASCESEFRQYERSGRLLVNSHPDSSATGVFQILYLTHHPNWSQSPETNITTLEGNLAFARRMFKEAGTTPWNESRSCWQNRAGSYEIKVANLR